MKIAVVILNYNGAQHLKSFLPTVISYSKEAEIWVADNASTDNSLETLKEFSDVSVLALAQNYGFAGGYNEALKQIGADIYVLLNSDVAVTQNWLSYLIQPLLIDQTVAAVQPKIKSWVSKDLFEYAGAAGGYIDKWGYPFCRGRIFDDVEVDIGQYDDTKEIFWASGACLCIRADLFHQYGGFDDRFFAHMEEIDLCWRLRNNGFVLKYVPNSIVFHLGGGTLNKSNPRKTFLNYRNNLCILFKNLPKGRAFYTILIRLVLDGLSGLKLLLSGKPKETLAIIKAHFSFYGMLPYLRKVSKDYKRSADGMKPFSLVWQYFVLNVTRYSNLPHD